MERGSHLRVGTRDQTTLRDLRNSMTRVDGAETVLHRAVGMHRWCCQGNTRGQAQGC